MQGRGTSSDEKYKEYKELFEKIDLFYRTLRSGINVKDKNGNTKFYFKSIMFLYAKSKGWTWDKKAIKEKFVSKEELKRQKEEHKNPDVLTFSGTKDYLVRDLLGVASSQTYRFYRFDLQYDEDNEIKRFKSPITFKPIYVGNNTFKVYLILNPIPDGIFDKEFKINKIVKKQPVGLITLKTPPLTKRFSIEEYLRFALKVDIGKHVEQRFQGNWRFRTIEKIYSQLRNQFEKRRQ